jgi:hypothetical protein
LVNHHHHCPLTSEFILLRPQAGQSGVSSLGGGGISLVGS